MKKILCLIVLMFMASACARQPSTVPPADSADRWQAFVARSGAVKEAPYLLNASLRFGTEGDTRRVTAVLWGNDSRSLRMDVMAGIGAVVAKIWESGDEFLVYSPTENRAFFHQGSNKPLLRVGVPVPFALDELAALLNGRLVTVFGDRYSDSQALANGHVGFTLSSAVGGLLEIDAQGQAVAWQENGSRGWSMAIAYDEAGLPRRVSLRHPDGQTAVLLVKERQAPAPFNNEQLSLLLPDSTPVLPLERYTAPQQ